MESPATFVDQLVVPGDVVLDLSSMLNQTIRLGGGLRQNFLIDTKGPASAFLPVFAFEGGTRRKIPKDIEYYAILTCARVSEDAVAASLHARIVKANTGMNPELSCTDVTGKAAEFAPLRDGYMFESSTGLSRIIEA